MKVNCEWTKPTPCIKTILVDTFKYNNSGASDSNSLNL